MAIIGVPDNDALVIKSLEPEVPQQANRSGWTGSTKIIGLPGAEQWFASVELADLATELEERPWRAFLSKLRGMSNTFRLRVACSQRTGTNPTVRPGASNGYSLPLQDLPANATVLRAGQYMTVPLPRGHERLVMLSNDLVSNGQGQGTATFEQALREVPNGGFTVETINPWLLCRSPERRLGLATSSGVSGRAFDVEEAL